MPVKRPAHSLPNPQGARAFIGGMREGCVLKPYESVPDGHLEIGGLTSVVLVVLRTVHLQFRVQFVPISLRPIGFPYMVALW